MKVRKDSEICADFNRVNAAAIAAGLFDMWEPDDVMLEQERRNQEAERATAQLAESKAAILRAIDPDADIVNGTIQGVPVEVRQIVARPGWDSRVVGWKVVIGESYANHPFKQWAVVGNGSELGVTPRQLDKLRTKLASVVECTQTKRKEEAEQTQGLQRYANYALNPENQPMLKRLTHCNYLSTYPDKGSDVNAAGLLTYCFEGPYTLAQWTAILDLRDAQLAAMKALKESFRPASAAVESLKAS